MQVKLGNLDEQKVVSGLTVYYMNETITSL